MYTTIMTNKPVAGPTSENALDLSDFDPVVAN